MIFKSLRAHKKTAYTAVFLFTLMSPEEDEEFGGMAAEKLPVGIAP
jgi:hypothetical protein